MNTNAKPVKLTRVKPEYGHSYWQTSDGRFTATRRAGHTGDIWYDFLDTKTNKRYDLGSMEEVREAIQDLWET